MRTAVLHALASSTNTTTPFLAMMVLLVWEDTPCQSTAIRASASMETLIRIPTGHMRFVTTHNLPKGEPHNLRPAKWPVELILTANAESKSQFL
jgi:hypothetical protein